ncbi:MAG: two-component sensor histidine kinase [Bacteroidetes bacterium]|nr:two-component sensor histidine kinase [Bacteroidota bacterium]
MKRTFIPLFWKFTIGIVLAIILFNAINIPIIWHTVSGSLERELNQRGVFIAKSIAEKSLSSMLYDDVAELNNIIDRTRGIDSNIAYILISDNKNNIIAHTFENGIPAELIKANSLKNNSELNVVLIQDENENSKYIRDIAVPVLGSKNGTIRVGLYENQIRKDINFTYNYLIIVLLLFLILSLLIAFLYSYVITTPIKFISQTANEINLDSLQEILDKKIVLEKSFSFKLRRLFFSHDEIDILYNKFIEMIERLEKTHTELQQTHKSLLNSEKLASVGILASGIAHEISNPISGIKNCIRRISSDPVNVSQNINYFTMMTEAANKIENVVQGLLHFSYKHEFVLTKTDIHSPLEHALLLASYHLEKSNITTINKIPANQFFISASQNQFEQVLLNLLINSVDAIIEKRKKENNNDGEIMIYCKSDLENVFLYIKDNGIGIPKDKLDKIFDPFFTTKQPGQGTGLGLPISYNIIKQHNGEIKIESEYGIGTLITIVLPVYKNN